MKNALPLSRRVGSLLAMRWPIPVVYPGQHDRTADYAGPFLGGQSRMLQVTVHAFRIMRR